MLAALCAIPGCGGERMPVQSAERVQAERLYAAATELRLRGLYVAAMDTTLAALDVDPTLYHAVFAAASLEPPQASAHTLDRIAAAADRVPEAALGACYRMVLAVRRGTAPPPAPTGPLTPSADACLRLQHAEATPRALRRGAAPRELSAERDLNDPMLVRRELSTLAALHSWEALRSRAKGYARPRFHPLVRAIAYVAWANAEHELGRDDPAAAVERAGRDDPAWQFAGYRMQFADELGGHPFMPALTSRREPAPLAAHADSVLQAAEIIRLDAARDGDLLARLSQWLVISTARLDRGRLDEAVPGLRYAVAISDSLKDSTYTAFALMRLGRALVKNGKSTDAVRELLRARALAAPLHYPNVAKEVEHNLLHLYEATRQYVEARDAGERFVTAASVGGLHSVRMMSQRDLGLFLRARGNVEESRPYFARMLADIDSLQGNWYFAAEYHELMGDLERAQTLYQRAQSSADEPVRALEGLVRIGMAMGDTAGTRRWAMAHDTRRDAAGRPESTPLLPGVAAATATLGEARTAFARARRDAADNGQAAAWAMLTVDLAALELDRGIPTSALRLADSALVAAQSVGDATTELRARALSALAAMRSGATPDALARLRSAALAGNRTASPQLRAELHAMVAEALTLLGRWREALDSYGRAAAPLDSVADRILLDPRQAEFRSAQRRVYDRALDQIVRHASEPGAARAYAEWSVRRKGRAYSRGTIGGAALPQTAVAGSAMVDYLILDSVVAALVVNTRGTTVVPLAAPAATVRSLVNRLRTALDVRVGSSLDLSRARYPLDIAHELYLALVAPIEPLFGGATSLTIVPDGVLGLVPFDALVTAPPPRDGSAAAAAFLLDRYAVTGATTLQRAEPSWRPGRGSVVAIAPPGAPGAEREVAAIQTRIESQRFVLLSGVAATTTAVRQHIANASIVHFIAHAEANEHAPDASWIRLAPDSADDGRLRASDASALALHAPLVILSACETANGRVLEGEGVLSLSRAFIRGGARASIATLWPVGSLAADFAAALYTNLDRYGDVRGAVHEAKRAMRQAGATPFAWAPFQLVEAPLRGPSPPQGLVAPTRR